MGYTIHDLVQLTGAAPRTIREYIRRGMVPKPNGVGPAAEYTDEHLTRLIAVVSLGSKGASLDDVASELAGWSPAKLRAFVAKVRRMTAAAETARQQAVAAPPESPVEQGDPVFPPPGGRPAALPPRSGGADSGAGRIDVSRGAQLPDGPRWVLVSLLPGLALMVREDAAPLVRRAAAEICETFGTGTS